MTIKGITIEIDGNTQPLQNALKDVNKESKKTQTELKEVEKALKLDPGNVELVRQKQELLTQSIQGTAQKLDVLRAAQAQVEAQFQRGDIGAEQYRSFQRELATTEAALQQYESQLQSMDGEQKRFEQAQQSMQNYLAATGQSIDELSSTLGSRLTSAIRDGSASSDQLEAAMRRVGQAAGHSGNDLEEFQRVLRNADGSSNLDQIRRDLEQIGDAAEEAEADVSGMADGMATAATAASAAVAGIGVGAGMAAAQFDNAVGQIQASLGVTREEAEALSESARNVWERGFGESLEEVSAGLVRVKQNMKQIDGSEIEKVTKNALALAKTFESDVNEVTRAGNNLMVNFGISADEAFDLMARGAQDGLNFSDEMFDNLAEYSPLFASMGYSADEYFGILKRGTENGIYNLDYANDLMKEFQIRVKDGSTGTSESMDQLSESTQKVWQEFLKGNGTVADVATNVVADLQKMDDQVLAGQIAVGLFGTKFEDLEAKAVYAMLGTKGGLEGVSGAMERLATAQEQTFGQRWESFARSAVSALEPLGKVLLDLAEQWLPKVQSAIESASNWFTNLSPAAQNTTLAIGAVVAAAGPLIMIFSSLASGIGAIVPLFASGGVAAGAFGAIIAAMTGPIGLTVAAIAAVGVAIGGLSMYLSQSSLEIESWEGKVSESTAKAVGSFMKLYDEASLALMNLSVGSQVVTQEMATNMISLYDQMGQQVLAEMQADHAEQLNAITTFYANSGVLVESEEAAILEKTAQYQANKEAQITEGNARIQEILTLASAQKREITLAEQAEINRIQETMKTNAIQYMTESQAEQQVILETMKNNASTITAEQAAQVVQNSISQKEKVVAEAQDQYTKTVAEIVRQRDEMGVISAAQAKQLIQEAGRQRDETVKAAEQTHSKVVKEAQAQATEHVSKVDWETGQVKSKWEVLKDNVSKTMTNIKTAVVQGWQNAVTEGKAKINDLKTAAEGKFAEMKTAVEGKIQSIKQTISSKFQEAKSAITKPIEEAKSTISRIVSEIKGFFSGMKLSIPKIKLPSMPKFTISGKFSLDPPSVPKIGVSWNALGGVFKKPTIFNTANAGLQGVGEAGAEAIIPLKPDVLAGIGKGIAEQMQFPQTTQNAQPIQVVVQTVLDGRIVAETITPIISQLQHRDTRLAGLTKGVNM